METSPTATDTTGVWHASDSLTTTGAPSHIDVMTATSAAFIASATCLRDKPSRLAATTPGSLRRSRSIIASKTSTRLFVTFERSLRAPGNSTQGPTDGHPRARLASVRSSGANKSRSTAHGITGASRTPKFAAIIGATAIGCVRLATSRDTLRCHGTEASLPWNVVTTGVASCRDAIAPESP